MPDAASEAGIRPQGGIVTSIAPTGPADAGVNLELMVAESNPEFDDVRVSCPQTEGSPRYPFQCELTAADRERGQVVAGEITVHGVYAPTKTYAFTMRYHPGGGG